MKNVILLIAFVILLPGALVAQSAVKVEKSGSGNPVLFLPGFVTPGAVWDETINNLATDTENHIATYAGFGGVEAIDTPWYNSLVTDLISYIEQHDLQAVTIIGHSMGGMLAADIAATMPDRVDKLVLVDALPCMREIMMPGVTAEQISYNNPYSNQMLSMPEEAFANMSSQMAAGMASAPVDVARIKEWILEADRQTYVYGYTDLLKLDLRSKLGDIQAKTLVLAAPAFGAEVVRKNMEAQYQNLENKEIALAPGGKHFIMLDQPEWFYQKVNTFLAE